MSKVSQDKRSNNNNDDCNYDDNKVPQIMSFVKHISSGHIRNIVNSLLFTTANKCLSALTFTKTYLHSWLPSPAWISAMHSASCSHTKCILTCNFSHYWRKQRNVFACFHNFCSVYVINKSYFLLTAVRRNFAEKYRFHEKLFISQSASVTAAKQNDATA